MHVTLQITLRLRPGINKVTEETENYTGSVSPLANILSSYRRTCWHLGGERL